MIPGLGRSPGEGIGYPLGKETACSAGDLGSTRGSGRSPGGQHGNPLPRSCLENSRCRGTWRAAVHGVAKSLFYYPDSIFISPKLFMGFAGDTKP